MRIKKDWKELLKVLGYRFGDMKLLFEALTHPSALAGKDLSVVKSYQRLEFVGDRVVNLLAAIRMFHFFPDVSEGEFTKYNPLLTSNQSLARVASTLDLGSYLNMAKGEEMRGGRNDPYILACAFEALMGAMYLDSASGYFAASRFLERCLFSDAQMLELTDEAVRQFDPKSELQRLAQVKFKATPEYLTIESYGQDHARMYKVGVVIRRYQVAFGVGRSLQEAQKNAAVEALRVTHGLTRNISYQLIRSRDILPELQFAVAEDDDPKRRQK